MEYISLFDMIMAILIAAIIIAISVLRNPVIKAIVYGLPIPITLALIATQKTVNGSHIVGLFLLTGFLWVVYLLKDKGLNVLLSDIFSSVIYVFLGYVFVAMLDIKDYFLVLFLLYVIFWTAMILFFNEREKSPTKKKEKVNLYIKGFLVFIIALVLLSTKNILEGIVVTFPFSGVFAVVEMEGDLEILAKEFTQNSIAILIFFLAAYLTFSVTGLYLSILAGWVFYWLSLFLVKKLVIK